MRYFTFLVIFVSSLGLNSCGSDRSDNSRNAFRIEQPSLHTKSGRTFSLTEASVETTGSMDLTDVVDFGQTKTDGITLSVQGKCLFPNGESHPIKITRPLKSQILLYELMPREIFYSEGFVEWLTRVRDFKISCSFAFTARSQGGDTHSFNLQVQMIDDPGESVATYLKANVIGTNSQNRNGGLSIPTFNESELYQVNLDLKEAKSAELHCSSFDEVKNLEHSDIAMTKFSWLRENPAEAAPRRVREFCRVVGFNDFGVTAISSYFYVNTNPPKFSLRVQNKNIPNRLSDIFGQLHSVLWDFETLVIENKSDYKIYYRLPPNPHLHAEVVLSAHLVADISPFAIALEAEGGPLEIYSIDKGQSVKLNMKLPINFRCDNYDSWSFAHGLVLRPHSDNSMLSITDIKGNTFERVDMLLDLNYFPADTPRPIDFNDVANRLRNYFSELPIVYNYYEGRCKPNHLF